MPWRADRRLRAQGEQSPLDVGNESTPAQQVGSAYLVFAAVDADGKPRPVPPVVPETERDKRRYQEAQIRRTHRLARRRAIKELRERRVADGIDD